MFYYKAHISEFLYFSKMLERLFTGIKTHRLFSVLCVFNSLGFVTIWSLRESLRSICCTELKLPTMLVMMLLKLLMVFIGRSYEVMLEEAP